MLSMKIAGKNLKETTYQNIYIYMSNVCGCLIVRRSGVYCFSFFFIVLPLLHHFFFMKGINDKSTETISPLEFL